MSQIALDEDGMGALARALLAGADRLDRAVALVRLAGLETGRAVAPALAVDRVAARQRAAAAQVRRRARAAREEESRPAPRGRALAACGPEWRTWSRAHIAAANAGYRLEELRRRGGGTWGVAGSAAGWVRSAVQGGAKHVQQTTGFIKQASDAESLVASVALREMDAGGKAFAAALPRPLGSIAAVFGSGVGGLGRAGLGGIVGTQAIYANNVDELGRLAVTGSHGDVDASVDIGREQAQADGAYVLGALAAMGQTARFLDQHDPLRPGAYLQAYQDVNDKGLTNALADDARAAGEEGPGAALLLIGEPPSPVARTVVDVGEAGAIHHGGQKVKPKDAAASG